jgi:hypothetical protein
MAPSLGATDIAPRLAGIHVTATTPLDGSEPASVASAVENEMAQRLPDVMFVSTYWGYEKRWAEESLTPIAAEMGERLGWDEERRRAEVGLTLQILR